MAMSLVRAATASWNNNWEPTPHPGCAGPAAPSAFRGAPLGAYLQLTAGNLQQDFWAGIIPALCIAQQLFLMACNHLAAITHNACN